MGLGDTDLLDDGDGGGGKASATEISCSICLEVVTDNLDRSWAKLQCGHQFHLDCIGSAFNVKGAMQCPNCRKIEKGQWLYANGSRPPPEFSMDDWPHDEDLYDQNYEMSLGLHWCPFSGLTRLFDEGEFSSSSYHDYLGQQALFAEHTTMSSTSHPCPYIAYIGPPIHPSSSTSSGSVSDGSNFNNNHWNGPSVPNEVPSSYAFPSMDVHYHNWDHSSSFPVNNRIGGGSDQPSISSVTQRTSRNSSDMPRPGMHPYMFTHSSSSRAPTSVSSSALPLYPGTVVRQRDRAPALQAYLQQSSNSQAPRGPLISSGRRSSSSHRGLAQVAPIASSSDQSSGFYFFSSNSSGRTFQEAENPVRNERFHGWERDHQASYPLSHVDRDSIWGPFHSPGSGSDRSNNFRQRPSQYRS